MRGVVTDISPRRLMIAIEVDGYGYTVAELLVDDDVDLGDVIQGNLRTHESEELRNVTKGTVLSVYIQAHDASPASKAELLRNF
jgi:hypothetical protein